MLLKGFWIGLLMIGIFAGFVKAQNTQEDSLKVILSDLAQQPSSLGRDSMIIKTITKIFMTLPSKEIAKREFYNDSLKGFAPRTAWHKAAAYQMYISGFMHTFRGENTLAFNDIERALIAFKKYQDKEFYQNAFDRLSVLMSRNMMIKPIANPILEKKYLGYLHEKLKDALAIPNNPDLSSAYAGLGQFYLMKKEYAKSMNYYQQGLSHTLKQPNPNSVFYSYHSELFFAKGLCPLYLNPSDKQAMATVEKVMKVCQTQKHNNYEKYLLLVMVHYMGNFYCENRQFQNALKMGLLGKNLEDFPQMPFYQYLVDNVLAKAYRGLGKPSEALAYLEKVDNYEEKSGAMELRSNLAEWHLKYLDEKQNATIKTLENEKLQTQANRNKWIRNLLIFILLTGCLFLFYTLKTNRKLRQKNRQIQEALFEGQTMERKRMASELHDNIANKILAVKMRIETIDSEHFTEKEKVNFASTLRYIDEVYSDVRLVSHNLLPEELESKGLAIAVENLVKKINLINKTNFDLVISQNFPRLAVRFEYEIYTIIFELVNNILKHAEANNAIIHLTQEMKTVKLIVEDNGKGVDNQAINSNNLGLKSVSARVETLKGHLEILSHDGTKVMIEVPT
ncbi:MAG: histidine kinase [Arcicella sp.]|jgi:signal transduction histidine kinase|nr:histidine kinase [Arcicella sp.]